MKTINIKTTHKNNNTKTTKKVIKNWSEYNKNLKNRGNLSFIIMDARKEGAFMPPKKTGTVGRQHKYSDELIKLLLIIRELFRSQLRQTTGFAEFLFPQLGICTDIPDYSTLSRRMKKLEIDVCRFLRQSLGQLSGHSQKGVSNDSQKEGIVVLIDGSGFKVFGEGEWKVRKHGYNYRRTWKETHILIDADTRDIIAITNTKSGVHDNTQFKPLIKQAMTKGTKIATAICDGAYDNKENYIWTKELDIDFIAPPPKNATVHYDLKAGELVDIPGWEKRNKIVRQIMHDGGSENWKQQVGYHRRSLVENAFYRFKTIFGSNLKSRTKENQQVEQYLRAEIINQFNKLGLPRYS